MSYLIMRRGPEPGKIYPLDADEITVGRGSKNQIIIHDNEVSRNHMQFVRTPSGYELHDLNSSNGTFVNGQLVEDAWLIQTQCIIELGDSITFEYRMGRPEDDPDVSEIYKSRGPTPVKEKSFLILTVEGRNEPEVYPLEGMTISVGRSTSNDIVVVEPELSREHFRLTLMPQGYFIEDLGSTNGTFVNGESLAGQRLLYTNDVIQIGTTIRLALTNSPDAYMERAVTTSLDGEAGKSDRRKTSRLPALAPSLEPTNTGTGVDHKSLEDEILITYARQDWEKIVAPMVGKLYEAGISSWVDQYLVERSNDWILATEQARLECWLLVVVISPAAMKSDLVKRNWRHFQNREKPIILVILDPVERMPIGANRLPTIQYNPALPDIAFQQLAKEIKRIKDPHAVDTSQKESVEAEKDTSEREIEKATDEQQPAEKETAAVSQTPPETPPAEEDDGQTSPKAEQEKRPAKPLMAALEAAKHAREEEKSAKTQEAEDDTPEIEDSRSTDEQKIIENEAATPPPLAEVTKTVETKKSEANDEPVSDSTTEEPDRAKPLAQKPLAMKGVSSLPDSAETADDSATDSSDSAPKEPASETESKPDESQS